MNVRLPLLKKYKFKRLGRLHNIIEKQATLYDKSIDITKFQTYSDIIRKESDLCRNAINFDFKKFTSFLNVMGNACENIPNRHSDRC